MGTRGQMYRVYTRMLALLTSTRSEPPRKGTLAYSVSAFAMAGAATTAAPAKPERRSRRETPSACICMHDAALVDRSDGAAEGAKAAAEPTSARSAVLRIMVGSGVAECGQVFVLLLGFLRFRRIAELTA